MSQIFAKYATQILAKYVTGATKKRDTVTDTPPKHTLMIEKYAKLQRKFD